ncbi:MAG TPA: putative toxin-antitoxin system toxin component, PIN family [Vicinamibacterales bacterium]|nr:putative toxin-antitoxin system toxin component, PIN family [Vicinamibacterales bacterium]
MTRVCLDTNVLVAAFAARGLCADLLALVLTDYHLVVPEVVVEELRRVLATKLRASDEALRAVEAVIDRCEITPRSGHASPVAVRDRDDERVLADALEARADILVTGDNDLLSIAQESPIRILSPRAFMTLARGGTL